MENKAVSEAKQDAQPAECDETPSEGIVLVRPIQEISDTVIILNILSIIMMFIGIVLLLVQLGFFGDKSAQAKSWRVVEFVYDLALVVLSLAGIIDFLNWIHRISCNCRQISQNKMKYSPGWNVACYFIPILNFYYPYLSMREIWEIMRNPSGGGEKKGNMDLVHGWWIATLVSGLFACVVAYLQTVIIGKEIKESYASLSGYMILGNFLAILSSYLEIKLVAALRDKQLRSMKPRDEEAEKKPRLRKIAPPASIRKAPPGPSQP